MQAIRLLAHPLTYTKWLAVPPLPLRPCLGEPVLPRVLRLPPKTTVHRSPLSPASFLHLVFNHCAQPPTSAESPQECSPSPSDNAKNLRSFNSSHPEDSTIEKNLGSDDNIVFPKIHPSQLHPGFQKTEFRNWWKHPDEAEKEGDWQIEGRRGAGGRNRHPASLRRSHLCRNSCHPGHPLDGAQAGHVCCHRWGSNGLHDWQDVL